MQQEIKRKVSPPSSLCPPPPSSYAVYRKAALLPDFLLEDPYSLKNRQQQIDMVKVCSLGEQQGVSQIPTHKLKGSCWVLPPFKWRLRLQGIDTQAGMDPDQQQ